jgi:hypothetical protein
LCAPSMQVQMVRLRWHLNYNFLKIIIITTNRLMMHAHASVGLLVCP